MSFPRFAAVSFLILSTALAFATTPVVTVKSPANGASVGSPVNYIASASSSACSKGIAAIRIYTAPGVNAYTINANSLNTNINLPKGSYSTVVQAWDNCGGVGKTTVNITVSSTPLAPPRFLYATEFKAGRIAEYVVNPLTGSLTATPQGSTWAHWGPVDIASDHWGNHLYVANQGSHDVNAYVIDRSTGNLTQVPGSPFALTGVGQRVVVHPSGKFVYATSSGSGSNIEIVAFSVQSNGSLVPIPGSPFPGGKAAGAIAIDPKGRYLYVADVTNGIGAVGGYAINQVDGALTPVPGSPFFVPVGSCDPSKDFCQQSPTDLAVDPQSKYVYATLGEESALAGFAIDQTTGALNNLPGSPYPEANPFGLFCPFSAFGACPDSTTESIDPNGKFIYVANDLGDTLAAFALNESNGVLTYLTAMQPCTDPNVPGISVPYTVAVDPSGSFVYTQGTQTSGCNFPPGASGVLAGFSINQGNGLLFSVPGNPFVNSNLHTTTVSEEKVLVTR